MLTWNAQHKPETRRVPIACRAGEFALYIRPPTYAERLADEGLSLQIYHGDAPGHWNAIQTQQRLETVITDWSGVEAAADGSVVPYSAERLIAVLTEHPDAASRVSLALAQAYSDNPDQLGESAAPPADSGGAETAPEPSPTC